MINWKLGTGLLLTAITACVVAQLESTSQATCYYIDITSPLPGTQFLVGSTVDVDADYYLSGYYNDMTRSLQCTMTSRVESTETTNEISSGSVSSTLQGPDAQDSDVFDPFCVVVSGGGEEDRVGVSFVEPCYCY